MFVIGSNKEFNVIQEQKNPLVFSGNIYIFHAFDVGDDIHLDKISELSSITSKKFVSPKYFKNYHKPLSIELPKSQDDNTTFLSGKVYSFGAISLTYKVPFEGSLFNLRRDFDQLYEKYQEKSLSDIKSLLKIINPYVINPKLFDVRSSYIAIQIDPQPTRINVAELQEQYGSVIASTLRFEIETLSEEQKNEILESAIGYFRGDLIIVDTDVAFIYDDEFHEIRDFFEFANIQQLELRYFDWLLDTQLNRIYEEGSQKLPIKSYLPFIGTLASDPVGELGKLKADISVITERLETSVKIAAEPYFSELYALLVEKLDLENWQKAIDRKLAVVHDIRVVYQHKIDAIREDMLSVLIIALIFTELVIGILSYLK